MRNFAFGKAETIAEAAAAAGLVAEAMLAPDGGARSEDVRVVKAGGIDLMDLMKEGLLAPAGSDEPRAACPASTRSRRRPTAASASDRWSRSPVSRPTRRSASAIRRWRMRPANRRARRSAPSPRIGGNLLQRPRCWYFRAAEFRCLRKGGGHCYAISGENQYHAIFDNRFCAIVHPSTSATALVALGAEVELTDADGGTRRVALEDFFVGPDRDVQRENDLRARRTPDRRAASAVGGLRMKHLKLAQKESFDWPLADVAVVLDLDAGRRLPARLDRARRGGADAVAGARGGGGAERKDDRCGSRRRGRTGRARRRDPALRQRLQGADVRGAGEAGDPGGRAS